MADLENAINGQQASLQSQPPPPNASTNSICVGEYIIGLFEDGFYPGEVLKVEKAK